MGAMAAALDTTAGARTRLARAVAHDAGRTTRARTGKWLALVLLNFLVVASRSVALLTLRTARCRRRHTVLFACRSMQLPHRLLP